MKISKDMKIADVLKKFPSTRKVFEKHLHACIKCGGSSTDTIERGARMHGIDPDTLIEELNSAEKPRKKNDV
jgi:hybrid cluster-associated redox disulfide protein